MFKAGQKVKYNVKYLDDGKPVIASVLAMIAHATKRHGITLRHPKTSSFTLDGKPIICGEIIEDPELRLEIATEEDIQQYPKAVFAVLSRKPYE